MNFLDLSKKRYAAKTFTKKQVSRVDLDYILEAGRWAPSSRGLEPWKFVVFLSDNEKANVAKLCLNQENVISSSVIIAIMAKKELEYDFVTKQIARFGMDATKTKTTVDNFLESFKSGARGDVFNYTSHQCYFPCLQMSLAAKEIGIDSCIIGGFDKDGLDKYIDLQGFGVSVVLVLGYSDGTKARKKVRLNYEDVVTIR